MLAFRVWITEGTYRSGALIGALGAGRNSVISRNLVQRKIVSKAISKELIWDQMVNEDLEPVADPPKAPLKAAE